MFVQFSSVSLFSCKMRLRWVFSHKLLLWPQAPAFLYSLDTESVWNVKKFYKLANYWLLEQWSSLYHFYKLLALFANVAKPGSVRYAEWATSRFEMANSKPIPCLSTSSSSEHSVRIVHDDHNSRPSSKIPSEFLTTSHFSVRPANVKWIRTDPDTKNRLLFDFFAKISMHCGRPKTRPTESSHIKTGSVSILIL